VRGHRSWSRVIGETAALYFTLVRPFAVHRWGLFRASLLETHELLMTAPFYLYLSRAAQTKMLPGQSRTHSNKQVRVNAPVVIDFLTLQ